MSSGGTSSSKKRCAVISSTPEQSPRQPACAAATAKPLRSANNTGRQSAVSTAHTTPRVQVHAASASVPGSQSSALTTNGPCTCSNQRGAEGNPPCSFSTRRLMSTCCASSPTCAARLKPTPLPRVVAMALTAECAAQSGRMISGNASFTATPSCRSQNPAALRECAAVQANRREAAHENAMPRRWRDE